MLAGGQGREKRYLTGASATESEDTLARGGRTPEQRERGNAWWRERMWKEKAELSGGVDASEMTELCDRRGERERRAIDERGRSAVDV